MGSALLDITDLCYTYADGVQALRGVDLQVEPGRKVGLIGPNGSGKSTLMMCVGGLFFGTGSIHIQGEALTKSNANRFRAQVGLVFQSPDDQLFMPTLFDDLAFGPINLGLDEETVHQRVHASAERMGLTALLHRAPHHLSMGQKRAAAIASVMTMQPQLLLMDEPSSNLDPRSRNRLIATLAALDDTLLIASHDLALIGGLCDEVALIDDGRIVKTGEPQALMADAALMHRHGLEVWQKPESQVE